MIYRMGVISRREDLTQAAYTAHWRDIHGHLASRLPGLGSYRQNHILRRIYEASPFPLQQIDGMSQLRFPSIEAMEAMESSPEYAACKADIPKFQGGITILVLARDDMTGAGARPLGGAKLIWISRLRPDADPRNWRSSRVDWMRRRLADIPSAAASAQNPVIDKDHPVSAGVPQGEPAADVVTEVWFDSGERLAKVLATPRGQELIFNDPHVEALAVYEVREHTVV